MVDIVVKDWYKFVDLFCKLFLIMCDDGQQRLVKGVDKISQILNFSQQYPPEVLNWGL